MEKTSCPKFLGQVINAMADPVFVKDRQQRIILVNNAFCHFNGRNRDELIGKTSYDLFPAAQADILRANAEKVFATRQEVVSEEQVSDARGVLRTIVTRKTFCTDDHGNELLVGVFRDMTGQKQLETRLAEALAYQKTLLEAAPIGIVCCKGSGEVVSVNSAAARIAGGTVEKIMRMNVRDLESAQRSGVAEAMEEVLATGREIRREFFVSTSFGKEVCLNGQITCFRHAGERYALLLGADITEHKLAECALRNSEDRFRALFNAGNDAVFVHAPFNAGVPGKFAEVNDIACRRLGYSRQELLQLSLRDLQAPEMNAELPGRLARLEAHGRAVWEDVYVAKDGWKMPVEVHAHQFELGGQPMVLTEVHDLTERKQAEMALRESEALYHSLVRHLPCGVFQKDALGRYVYINDRFYEQDLLTPDLILGKTPAEFEKNLLASAGQDDNERMIKQLNQLVNRGAEAHAQIMRTGETMTVEAILNLPDGTAKHFQIIRSPVMDTDGQIIGSQGIQLDITEQKQSELALRESEHRYRSLFANMVEGLAYCRVLFAGEELEDLIYLAVNDAFTVLTGLREVVGRKLSEVVPGILQADRELLERYGRVARTGKPERFEMYVKALKMWFSLSVYSPLKEHIMVVFDVITERKQKEEQLRKLSLAVEQSPVSIVITDPEGKIEYVNPKFVSVTGYTLAEVLHQNPRVLKSGLDKAELYQDLWSTIRSGREWHGEFCNKKKNGELFWESVRISPIIAASGEITHFLAIKEDITAHRKLEQEFRQAQKMDAFGRLAAGVAHDFNNMMTSVLCGAELLKMDGPLADSQQDAVTEITAAANRATALTRQLLMFSRRQAVQLKVLELNEVVEAMGKMLRRLIGEDISLKTHYGPGGSSVLADPGMLDQVLMNLAVNSRDAMPKGGDLLIQTATREIINPIGRQRPGWFIRLSVSDTGCGIAPADMEHIFEPFFTTKEVGKGTGLGLATVFGIVEQHKGWIEVESQVGKGTAFHIYLPRQNVATGTSAAESATARESGGKETILLVEDDPSVRAIARGILARHGYRILEAASGVKALELWKHRRSEIDLLFTDVVMPGRLGGVELGRLLSKDKPGLKVVYTSGYTDEMLNENSALRQTQNFVEKPYSSNVLLRKVRAALD